jgi:squalene-hopene/tetraprenyl-beta-curcumene cyclase
VNVPWLLECQHVQRHPFTGASPGGWGWTDLSGAVPDADDTAGALLALGQLRSQLAGQRDTGEQIAAAAWRGIDWLLDLQNSDGGWPTFCRGWGRLPFDRSSADLTAHALRALHLWQPAATTQRTRRIAGAMRRGCQYLDGQQRSDGSWTPLWFGNQDHVQEENPVYGTARVLRAYEDLGTATSTAALRGYAFLESTQREDGGWSGCAAVDASCSTGPVSSIEETAVAVEALWGHPAPSPTGRAQLQRGLAWLVEAVGADRHRQPAPIGFYFAKLWYYEKLYPLVFTVAALGRAVAAGSGR